jgi:tetratricopeptide (TPR) repeat protein
VGSQGRLSEAVTLLEPLPRASPIDPDVHLNFGNALAESGQVRRRSWCYPQIHWHWWPDHVDAHFNLGTLFKRIGRLDEAAAAYRNVLVQLRPR